MDTDEYICGTCKHGILYDQCQQCENEFEQTRMKHLAKITAKVIRAQQSGLAVHKIAALNGLTMGVTNGILVRESHRAAKKQNMCFESIASDCSFICSHPLGAAFLKTFNTQINL